MLTDSGHTGSVSGRTQIPVRIKTSYPPSTPTPPPPALSRRILMFTDSGHTGSVSGRTHKPVRIKTLYFIVRVIPKEGLPGLMPAKPSYGLTTTKQILRPCFWVTCLTFKGNVQLIFKKKTD